VVGTVMVKRFLAVAHWLIHLFEPPPLASMSLGQKIGRIFNVCLALLVICILTAITAAAFIFGVQQTCLIMGKASESLLGLEIIALGLSVNAICFYAVLRVRKLDLKLNLPD